MNTRYPRDRLILKLCLLFCGSHIIALTATLERDEAKGMDKPSTSSLLTLG